MNLCNFEDSMVYMASSRTAEATQINPVSRNQNKQIMTFPACDIYHKADNYRLIQPLVFFHTWPKIALEIATAFQYMQ